MIQAFEIKGQVDGNGQLILENPLMSLLHNKQVRIIVLLDREEDEYNEAKELHSLSVDPAFDFLKDEAEDIYTLKDGQPFTKF